MTVMICVTSLNYAMGGVSTHILDLCKCYSKASEIDAVIVCCDGGEHIDTLTQISKVRYIHIPFQRYSLNMSGVLNMRRDMLQVIRSEKIDIIHVHSQRIIPAAQLIKIRYHIPYVWTNHIDEIPNQRIFKIMCLLFRFPVISVSQEPHELVIKKFYCNPEKTFVVNNGTNLEGLTPLTGSEKEQLEKQYEIDRGKTPYVICLLSRVNWAKGHKLLLEAINRLEIKHQIKVIFAGHTYPDSVEFKNEVLKYAEKNEIETLFLDFSKPRDVFGVSDLFVLPSLYEGFALVCIEALAMGCAVIRSRTPGWQEMQDWVEIVEKNDVEGLACKIQEVVKNGFNQKKTRLGQEAVWSIFTKENCAKNTIAVYRKIISGKVQ